MIFNQDVYDCFGVMLPVRQDSESLEVSLFRDPDASTSPVDRTQSLCRSLRGPVRYIVSEDRASKVRRNLGSVYKLYSIREG